MYDPTYKSCTLFICTVAREKWGFQAPDLRQLVEWANIIDGAQYPDAKTAVELGAPAMQLTLVIEGAKGLRRSAAYHPLDAGAVPGGDCVRTGNPGVIYTTL